MMELLFKFEGEKLLLYPYQKKFLLDSSHFRIIMKARQLGLSWIIALEGLFAALTKPYQTILFVSSGEEAAKRVLQYVYSFIHGMPIKPRLITKSLTECRFLNHSRIVSLPNNDRCYSGDTEILTKRGWIRFDTLQDDDIVAQVDKDTRELTYIEPNEVVRMESSGKMIHINNERFDCLVSPNHRLLLYDKRVDTKSIEKASEISRVNNRMFTACKFIGGQIDEFKIPKTNNWSEEILMSGDNFCRFMGIYLAEGCSYGKKGQFCQVDIAQYPGVKRDKINDFLQSLKIKYSQKKYKFTIWNKSLYDYLKPFGYAYEKYVPDIIKNATPKQIKIFLDWFGLGDGHLHNGRWRFSTTSKKLADDLQEMLIKIGSGARIRFIPGGWFEANNKKYWRKDAYSIWEQIDKFGERRYYSWFDRNKHVKEINYTGKIYCVSVPTGFILVRRNGKALISGNTVRGYRAHKVYCDEFAALMNDNEILAAIQPSISRGGDLTILSSPRGRANRFWDIWDDDQSGYSKHRISWQECPDAEYHRMVKRMQRTMLDLDFRQEFCCFTDKTLVNTDDSYRSIANIKVNDLVLTHTGKYKKVKNIFKRHYNNQLIKITTWMNSAFPIICTPEHPILCESGFKQAKDIRDTDKIIYKFNTTEQNHVIEKSKFIRDYSYGFRSKWFHKIPDKINVDCEIAELLGWYIAEGCEIASGRAIQLTLSYNEIVVARRLQDIIQRRFNVKSTVRSRGSVTTLIACSTILVDIFRQFGIGARNKKLPLWCKVLPRKIQNSLLNAIVNGDGYFGKNALCITSASPKLVLDLKDVLLRLGYAPRIKKYERDGGVIDGRKIGRFVGYDISASYNGSSRAELIDDYVTLPIRKKYYLDSDCFVYNLEVEDDNSYAIEYASVHNCDPSISDMAFFTRELLKWVVNHDAHYLSGLESQNKTVMGIDFGKRVSSTVITIAEKCDNLVKIRLQEELRNMPYDFEVGEKSSQLRRIAAINDAFNVDEINIDATGVGVRLEEDMRRLFGAKVESVIFTSKVKEILITNFKILCEKHGIELVNDAEFISQLLSLEREVLSSGNIRYKHIKSKKDDRVWSAALAVKDMLSPDNSGGYIVGGEMVSIAVNRHIEDMEPIPSNHIIVSRFLNAII